MKTACSYRRGVVLPVVLICVIVCGGLAINLVQRLQIQQRGNRLHEEQIQLTVLMDCALRHAEQKLAADATFSGMTWELQPEDWPLARQGKVQITVSTTEQGTLLTAAGEIQEQNQTQLRKTRTLTIQRPTQGDNENAN